MNIQSHKTIFIIDGMGALLSAFLLGCVLTNFEHIFGIPTSTLLILASIPAMFVVYDLLCLMLLRNNQAVYLRGIALMNLLYCCLSIGFAIFHYDVITQWGLGYLLAEILIIIPLAIFELSVAKKLN